MSRTTGLGCMLGALLLTGCAAAPQSVIDTPVLTEIPPPADNAALPAVDLDAQLLYQLLVAEFSAQQGALHLSAQAYLQTASTTRDPRLASRATRMAIYARDMELALHAARLWVELDPQQIDARQSLAALLLRHGHAEQAVNHLRQMIALSPQNTGQGFMLIANLLSQEGDRPLALRIMQTLAAEHPDEPMAHYAHAHLANQLGEQEYALQVLNALLARWPDMLDARVLQARVYYAGNNEGAALKSMATAVQQHPDNHQMRMIYARMLVDAGQHQEARKQFKQLNKAKPGDGDIVYALALLAQEAGDLGEAEGYYRQLIQIGERGEEARLSLGQLALQQQRYDESIEWFQSIGTDSERYMDAQIQAARLILQQQDLKAALRYLRGLSLHSQSDIAQRYLGEADLLNAAGEPLQAMEVYDEAVALFMDHADLLYARALLAEKLDRLDQAEADLRRILESDPEHVHALNALGYTLIDRTDRYQEGLEYIQRAYQQNPDDPAILDSMGWAYYRLDELEQAEAYLRRAYALLPDAEIGAHLGEVLWQQGKQDEARQIWQQAQELNPEHPVLLETLQRLVP